MDLIPIGQAADRLGLSPSAFRYYDERGLVLSKAVAFAARSRGGLRCAWSLGLGPRRCAAGHRRPQRVRRDPGARRRAVRRRGGRIIVPDIPDQPIQHIDVRDLATWILTAGEQRLSGAYDGVGPTSSLDSTLREIADLVAPHGTELVGVSAEKLTESGVKPWAGPTSLPLWLPASHYGFASHDAASSWTAGLHVRPLADTVHAALVDERALGLDRPRKAGLTAEEEAALLT